MSLSFKADPRLIEALKRLAKAEDRSLANYVIRVLTKHVEGLGVKWRKEDEK